MDGSQISPCKTCLPELLTSLFLEVSWAASQTQHIQFQFKISSWADPPSKPDIWVNSITIHPAAQARNEGVTRLFLSR